MVLLGTIIEMPASQEAVHSHFVVLEEFLELPLSGRVG